MTELQRLLAVYDQHRAAGRTCALATVVEVLGQAQHRAGTRMLVTADGHLTGIISCNCLKGDARRRVAQALQQGQPTLINYDASEENNLLPELEPGYSGTVRIFLEPLDFRDATNPMELLRSFVHHPRPAVLVTVFGPAAGDVATSSRRWLLTTENRWLKAETSMSKVPPQFLVDARMVLANGHALARNYATEAGQAQVFLEALRPASPTVFGVRNDEQPLIG